MAQVYSFVDENGVTRLFAEIHPDPAGTPFDGGTITQPLTIDPASAAGGVLVLDSPGHTSGDTVLFAYDDLGHAAASLTADGSLSLDTTLVVGGIRDGPQLFVVGGTAQPSPMMEVFTDDGLAYQLDKKARPVLSVHAAPADGDLAAGECALWFDQTNGAGATKLMVKGKSADGTVKTAAIVLT